MTIAEALAERVGSVRLSVMAEFFKGGVLPLPTFAPTVPRHKGCAS